jgi:hypothetical protein
VGNPGRHDCPNRQQQKQNPESAKGNRGRKPVFPVKQGQMKFVGNISLFENVSLLRLLLSNLGTRLSFRGGRLWHPRFLISIISANDRISRVKPADVGQTMVNLGHHLENLTNNN